ncbi:MAG: GNAT family N-acetyltransferase [Deltaproteobacteria bacterium]|nr:GNAT family N-acetyltransferase [Deltaproteobacteria bacterium]
MVDPHNPFRDEETACALELLEAVLVQPEGNTYEALAGFDESAQALCYACFGATPMTDATFDLYWMVTAPHLRGQGLGGQLLTGVQTALTKRGARSIRIETSSLEGQGGAKRFYERHGFKVVGLIADFYRPGDDLVTLVKRLVP